jgi:hypothetical protein
MSNAGLGDLLLPLGLSSPVLHRDLVPRELPDACDSAGLELIESCDGLVRTRFLVVGAMVVEGREWLWWL